MNTVQFLAHLRSLDITIWSEGDQLRYNAPQNALTAELRRELVQRKADILAFLRQAEAMAQADVSSIQVVPRSGLLPLSFGQQRLWFLQQLWPESPAYNIPIALQLSGVLNETALSQSLREIIRRHESLRMTFDIVDEYPVQRLAGPPETYSLEVRPDEEAIRLRLPELAWQPFNLGEAPLFRTHLFQLNKTEHILFLNFHHIIFDGWSKDLFYRELSILYRRYAQPDSEAVERLPDLPVHYVDFAHWEHQQFQKSGEQGLAYWRNKLQGEPPALSLPSDYARPAIQTGQGGTLSFTLSEPLTEALRQLSQRQGVTLFMTLLAAFKTLLYRYTELEDIWVGVPTAGRNRREIENLIGFFVNTLVMRTDLSGNPSFEQLLDRVRETTLEAFTYQDVPFERLVADLHPQRDLSQQPLFQVMFELQGAPVLPTLPGVQVTPLPIARQTAKFDLLLELTETGQGLSGLFEYSRDLFNAHTIERMIGHFQTLLEGIVANPAQTLSDLPLLVGAERYQLLTTWNDTAADYPRDRCLHQLFEAQVERTPEAVAVIVPGLASERQLTYRELNEQANQLAHHLRAVGVGPEIIVGLCVERSLEMAVGLLGILKAGGAYVPLDPTYPKERLAFMLRDSQTAILLTQKRLVDALPQHEAQIICLDGEWTDHAPERRENPVNQTAPDNLVYIIYTSGSTGRPKGVMVLHKGVVNYLHWAAQAYPIGEGQGSPVHTSISFDLTVTSLWLPLITGQRALLLPEDRSGEGLSLISERGKPFSLVKITPAHLGMLKQLLSLDVVETWAKAIVIGGEALGYETVSFWLTHAPGVKLINEYGPTETVVGCCVYEIPHTHTGSGTAPIGRPIANTQLYILDRSLHPVPAGVPGELYIAGAGLARGYLNRPEQTATKFIPNPFGPEGTLLYKTGDLARYLADGTIEFLGRIDHQVKIRGYRVELEEIESLLSQHPALRQVVVSAQEDASGTRRLVAHFVCQTQLPPPASELRQYLAETLPHYMIPSAFIPLDTLPLTPAGKIDRRALQVPEAARLEQSTGYVAPRTPLEQLLAGIWSSVLGRERLSIHDDFFELGGHSLQVTQIVLRIRRIFHIELPLRHFFEQATIAGMAQAIQAFRQDGTTQAMERTILSKLEVDQALDPAIQPKPFSEQSLQPQAIFLTGATGFLGAFLLHDLLQKTGAEIYCLVRAASPEAGYQRIQAHLADHLLWQEDFKPRIKPVMGDLAQSGFGLSPFAFEQLAQQVEVVYHGGAETNLVYPYDRLKPTNIGGTQEVLRLATLVKTIPLHYISTVSVFASLTYFGGGAIVYEDEALTHWEDLFTSYAQSKWVAEKLVIAARSRGLPVSIYRPGLIVGHSRTGVWKTGDFTTRFLKVCLELGSMPLPETVWYMTPVDYVSQAVVQLSRQPQSFGQAFHLITPYAWSTEALVKALQAFGYPVQLDAYAEWRTKLINLSRQNPGHALYSLLPVFLESISAQEPITLPEIRTRQRAPKYDQKQAVAGLAGTGISCPPVDAEVLSTYLAYLIEKGFLAAPSRKKNYV